MNREELALLQASKPRRLAPHGTRARYQWDTRHGRLPCLPCVEANRYEQTRWRRLSQGRPEPLHHTGPGDLYPIIGLLAELLGGHQ